MLRPSAWQRFSGTERLGNQHDGLLAHRGRRPASLQCCRRSEQRPRVASRISAGSPRPRGAQRQGDAQHRGTKTTSGREAGGPKSCFTNRHVLDTPNTIRRIRHGAVRDRAQGSSARRASEVEANRRPFQGDATVDLRRNEPVSGISPLVHAGGSGPRPLSDDVAAVVTHTAPVIAVDASVANKRITDAISSRQRSVASASCYSKRKDRARSLDIGVSMVSVAHSPADDFVG